MSFSFKPNTSLSRMKLSSRNYGGFPSSSRMTQSDAGPSSTQSREPRGAVPLTVKQISQASQSSGDDKSSLRIDGVDVACVKLLGMIFDKTEKVTDVSFVLDDGTGRIACKRWVNEASDRKQIKAIKNGMYVHLEGHLKTFKNNTEIVVFNVRPVSNFDEFTLHYVECIHRHMQNMKSQPRDDTFSQRQVPESSPCSPVKNVSNEFHSSQTNQMSADGLKDIDQRVLDCLHQPSSSSQEKGLHRDEIAQNLKLPVDKIMQSISYLEDEGLVYSTVDEFHFKSTNS